MINDYFKLNLPLIISAFINANFVNSRLELYC